MEKWTTRDFQNLKLKHKIVFSSLLVLFFSLVLVAVSMNIFFTSNTTQMANQYTLQGIQQVNGSIESNLSNIGAIIDMVSHDTDVIEFLLWDTYLETDDGLNTRSNIRNLFTNMIEPSNIIAGIMLVNADDFFISNEMYHDAPTPIIEEAWYRTGTAAGEMVILRLYDNRSQKYFGGQAAGSLITLVKPLYLPKSNEAAGVILVDLDVGFVQDITADISWDKTGFVLVLDEKNDVIYAPANDVTPRIRPEWFEREQGVFNKKINGQDYEFVYQVSDRSGWKAVGVFSRQITLQPIIRFRWFIAVMLMVTGLFSLGIVNLLSRTIVRPIHALNRLMQKAAGHDYSVHFNVAYEDEIGELGSSFNMMVDETRSLIGIVKAEQREKRKAELQILQEQIKPHFLYNTFDTIHWIAKDYGATEVVEIVRSLTTFLRVGLSRGREVITLREEMDHVVSYLTIQRHRYRDKLRYRLQVEARCEACYVQKLILQPLVENAIYHGLKNRDDDAGRLLVEARQQDGMLVLAVTDNGVGIAPERLKEIRSALEDGVVSQSMYGLRNVSERIRINYGRRYGIRIRSKPGHFTRMEIWHPLIHGEREGQPDEA